MRHRLLCCSDTHGDLPPALDESGAVAWLHAGDVVQGAQAPDLEDISNPLLDPLIGPVAKWFAHRPVPVFAVRGNHDVTDVYGAFRPSSDLTGRIVRVADDLCVAGVGWHGQMYPEQPRESDLEAVCTGVLRAARRQLMARDCVVVLTHYPPKIANGFDPPPVGDFGWRYESVRRLAEELSAVAVVQGHIHQWFGQSRVELIAGRKVVVAASGPDGCTLTVDTQHRTAAVQWPDPAPTR